MKKKQKCHDISLRTQRQAISIRRGHFQVVLRNSRAFAINSCPVVLAFTANKQTNTLNYTYIDTHTYAQ